MSIVFGGVVVDDDVAPSFALLVTVLCFSAFAVSLVASSLTPCVSVISLV